MKLRLEKSFLTFVMGVLTMCGLYGCSEHFKYERFHSKTPEMNISIDYLSGWRTSEYRDIQHNFMQTQFVDVKSKNKSLCATMVITVKESAKVDFQPADINGLSDDLITKRSKLPDAKVLSNTKTMLLGAQAFDILLSYKAPDKLYSTDVKLIPVMERVILFEQDSNFYIVRYENTAKEFSRFNKAFYHCVKTLAINK